MQTWIKFISELNGREKTIEKCMTLVYILTPILGHILFIPLVELTWLREEGTRLISDVHIERNGFRIEWFLAPMLQFYSFKDYFFIKLNWLCFEFNPLNGYIF